MINMLKQLYARVRLIITKGIIINVDDSTEVQLVNIECLDGELFKAVERLQEYGLSTVPPINAGCIVGSQGGDRGNSVILKTGVSASRPKDKQTGDVTLWDVHGNKIEMTADGVKLTSTEVVINNGTKGAARVDDPISTTLNQADLAAIGTQLAGLFLPQPSPVPPEEAVPITGTNKILSGSSTVLIGD